MRPKYWSVSFSISPSNECSGLISFRIEWFDLLADQGTLKSLLQHHSQKASIQCSPSEPSGKPMPILQFSSVQFLSHVRLFEAPWTAACQACLPFLISWSLLRLMSIESVMPSNYLILCCPLLLLPSILPNIRVFS